MLIINDYYKINNIWRQDDFKDSEKTFNILNNININNLLIYQQENY